LLFTASGSTDAFISAFDFTGNWLWANAWGGSKNDSESAAAYDQGALYVCGRFTGVTDFGGSGGPWGSRGGDDTYLARYNPANGNLIGVHTWGGDNNDAAIDVDYVHDPVGGHRVYVCGSYMNSDDDSGVDFDPSTGTDIRSSKGVTDAFVSKFSGVTGAHLLTYTWGNDGLDVAYGVNCHITNGWAVGGHISGVVDLNPTSGQDNSGFRGFIDAFIVTFESDDSYNDGYSFGGPSTDFISGVDSDADGNPFVSGTFYGEVDFNPSGGVEIREAAGLGETDSFVAGYWTAVTIGYTPGAVDTMTVPSVSLLATTVTVTLSVISALLLISLLEALRTTIHRLARATLSLLNSCPTVCGNRS